jgi:hypothetical protein
MRKPAVAYLERLGLAERAVLHDRFVLVLEVGNELFEFGRLLQAFEMWVDSEKGPARETGVDAAFHIRL